MGLSTSGDSRNVLLAIREAKARGAVTVGFSGEGGALKSTVDYAVAVPSKDPPRIQESHITAGHIICYLAEQGFVAAPKVDI
jgi:D-sedoheptulose 7-phosphate isomerase